MVKVTTFNDRFVRHARYMPDGTVILKLYERRPSGHARHFGVSLAQQLAGRGIYLLDSHASQRARPGSSPAAAVDDENAWEFGGVSNRE